MVVVVVLLLTWSRSNYLDVPFFSDWAPDLMIIGRAADDFTFPAGTDAPERTVSPIRLFTAIMLYVGGVVRKFLLCEGALMSLNPTHKSIIVMMASDTQKFFMLKMAKEYKIGKILIADGWFATCRNTNYLGEIMLYSAFAICAQHWFPWAVYSFVWICFFIPRWYYKEASFRRKKGGAEYIARTAMILPFPLWPKLAKA